MDLDLSFSLSINGLEGTGKTTFILKTMPLPMLYVCLGERSPNRILYEMDEKRRSQIEVVNLQPSSPEGWTYQEAKNALQEIARLAKEKLPSLAGGTIAIDSGSRFWTVMQKVYVEPKEQERLAKGLKSIGGLIYEDANLVFEGFITYARTFPVYLVLTHTLRQDWDAEGPIPNSFSPRWQRQVPYLVEVCLEFKKLCAVCKAPSCQQPKHVGRVHVARILKLSSNTSFEGLEIEDPSFEKINKLYLGL